MSLTHLVTRPSAFIMARISRVGVALLLLAVTALVVDARNVLDDKKGKDKHNKGKYGKGKGNVGEPDPRPATRLSAPLRTANPCLHCGYYAVVGSTH